MALPTSDSIGSDRLFSPQPLILRYEKPAEHWVEALPCGNGRIGGMVFGTLSKERIALNEDTLWSGAPREWNNPDAKAALPKVREALLAGQYVEAAKLCQQMQGPFTQSYQPLGELSVDLTHSETEVTEYTRELDLDTAITRVRYRVGDTVYTRETFISFPDLVLVLRLECDVAGQLSGTVRLDASLPHTVTADSSSVPVLQMTGRAPLSVDPDYRNAADPVVYDTSENPEGMSFVVHVHAHCEGGTLISQDDSLTFDKADTFTLFLSAATSFNGFDKSPGREGRDPQPVAAEILTAALGHSFVAIRERHLEDYRSLFRRVTLNLGHDPAQAMLSTDNRIRHFHQTNDPALATLLFQYGRYLLITSSRPGTQPANLQGIWNDSVRPPWSSNYTLNINAEMNYWHAESANLSECHLPLLDFITNLAVSGRKTAAINYGCSGWVAHHNSDIWCQSAPVGLGSGDPAWANWQMGGAWLCQHLFEHYRFTQDSDFLKNKAWHLMRGAAEFCLDWLIEDKEGHLVTAPSTSPEHGFITSDGQRSAVSIATTMDMAITYDLFTNCIEAAEILGIEEPFVVRLRAARERLFPMQIGSQGQLLEYFQEFMDQDVHHRHVSHLFGLFPGRQILPERTPEWASAVKRSLEIRGDAGTGWSLGWKINLWARLLDGDHAYELIRRLLTLVEVTGTNYQGGGGVYANLFDAHPPFQIDGNFAFTSGVIEMLLQSHEISDRGVIKLHLLPALPKLWQKGEVTGLRARGGFLLDIAWDNGVLTAVQITSHHGLPCEIRHGDKTASLATQSGQSYQLDGQLNQTDSGVTHP